MYLLYQETNKHTYIKCNYKDQLQKKIVGAIDIQSESVVNVTCLPEQVVLVPEAPESINFVSFDNETKISETGFTFMFGSWI